MLSLIHDNEKKNKLQLNELSFPYYVLFMFWHAVKQFNLVNKNLLSNCLVVTYNFVKCLMNNLMKSEWILRRFFRWDYLQRLNRHAMLLLHNESSLEASLETEMKPWTGNGMMSRILFKVPSQRFRNWPKTIASFLLFKKKTPFQSFLQSNHKTY